MDKSFDIPLHDIKPIVDITEYSLYYFIGISVAGIVLACGISYILYKWFVKRKVYNIRKEHHKLINQIDLNDTKNAAYALTMYGATFKNDGQRQTEMFQTIIQKLEKYKYKKTIDEKFDSETLGYIELYKEMLDV